MGDALRLHTRRRIELGLSLAAVAAVLIAGRTAEVPPLTVVLLFGGLVFLAENAAVVLPSSAGVSPSFMLTMAAITALAREGVSAETVVLGAATVGFCAGVLIDCLRERKYDVVVFNAAQFLLSSAGAAAAFTAVYHDGTGQLYIAAPLAAAVYTVLNVGFVLPWVALRYDESPAVVWADMKPAVPNSLAFGLLGVLVGQLYHGLGPLAVPLVLIPAVVARSTFSSYLELKAAHEAAVRVFVRAIEAKDHYTAGHSERVAKYAHYIGEELGFRPARMEHLRYAALMHDIGKLAVPSALLNKPGKLTPEEFALVRRHNDVCIEILTRVDFLRSTIPAASDKHGHYAADDVRDDPEALEAYAIAVADAFDAMTSTRSYRRALTQEVAFEELRAKAGTQFHPASVEALIRAIERRGEQYGFGHEVEVEQFKVAPPVVGVGSAGLGDLLVEGNVSPA